MEAETGQNYRMCENKDQLKLKREKFQQNLTFWTFNLEKQKNVSRIRRD